MKALVINHFRTYVYFVLSLLIIAGLFFEIRAGAANTLTGANELVSMNNVDGEGADDHVEVMGISSDGSKMLLYTNATNLPGITGTTPGLYVHDRNTNNNVRVDVSTNGVTADNSIRYNQAVMSENGRHVAFISYATNLIDGQTMVAQNIYVRDLQAGTTSFLDYSVNINLSQIWDYLTGISNDGRFVTLDTQTAIHRSVSGVTRSGYYDVIRYDRVANNAKLVNMHISGNQQSVYSTNSRMSCDGSFVVFQSYATNLVSGQSGNPAIYLSDIRNGERLSLITAGGAHPKISCNGNYIVYTTYKNNTEIPNPPSGMVNNTKEQLVLYNRLTGEKKYISSNSAGTVFSGRTTTSFGTSTTHGLDRFAASISDSGNVTFSWSSSTTTPEIYLKHISDGSGTLEPVQRLANGTYVPLLNTGSKHAYISANDKYLGYNTNAYALGLLTGSSAFSDAVRSPTGL